MFAIYDRPLILYLAVAAAIFATLLSGEAHALNGVQQALGRHEVGVERRLQADRDCSRHQAPTNHGARLCCGTFCAWGWLPAVGSEVAFASRVAGPALWPADLGRRQADLLGLFRPPKVRSVS